ncbi:hypothetical protein [Vallitalea guaymasensis]|uniref:Uncharacterized protein n=1 Tax=Vallitalea guaymasensis TaxID=1185412 RepID=A0A8J8MDN8_9FIRM|nr:hypothetical protein [Vallitalea guaymasensis]QUH31139.1 hypothetical protein HYG85_20325 [Vallitalea guaymasensis]
MDGIDVSFILTVAGTVLAVVGIGLTIYFGVSHVTKKNNKNNTEIDKSFNPKASKNSNIKMEIKDSFNTKQDNGSKD